MIDEGSHPPNRLKPTRTSSVTMVTLNLAITLLAQTQHKIEEEGGTDKRAKKNKLEIVVVL